MNQYCFECEKRFYLYEQDNRNILRDDSGHLKVADFGISELLKVSNRVKEDRPLIYEETSCEFLEIILYSYY